MCETDYICTCANIRWAILGMWGKCCTHCRMGTLDSRVHHLKNRHICTCLDKWHRKSVKEFVIGFILLFSVFGCCLQWNATLQQVNHLQRGRGGLLVSKYGWWGGDVRGVNHRLSNWFWRLKLKLKSPLGVGWPAWHNNSSIFNWSTNLYKSQLLLLGKFEYGGGPIFKVVLEC